MMARARSPIRAADVEGTGPSNPSGSDRGWVTRKWLALAGVVAAVAGAVMFAVFRSEPADPGRVVFSARPDASDAQGWQLLVTAPGGRQVRRLLREEGDVAPSWGPDGTRVVFERANDGYCDEPLATVCSQLWIVSAEGGGAHRITPSNVRAEDPDWSPSGLIAYVEWSPGGELPLETDIYRITATGGNRQRLTQAPGTDADPAWSPDGRRIAFSSERDGNFELYVMNADGSSQRRLTRTRDNEYDPHWSPNGKRITFWRRGAVEPDDDVVVVNAEGSEERTLTPAGEDGNFPTWSPDGKRILYKRGIDDPVVGGGEIWVMDADGSDRHQYIVGPFTEPDELDWAPSP